MRPLKYTDLWLFSIGEFTCTGPYASTCKNLPLDSGTTFIVSQINGLQELLARYLMKIEEDGMQATVASLL